MKIQQHKLYISMNPQKPCGANEIPTFLFSGSQATTNRNDGLTRHAGREDRDGVLWLRFRQRNVR